MNGFIGLTDPDWYAFLSTRRDLDEVNFWQPHGTRAFRAVERGEPFFFKLRAPQRAIAGFGFFERFEIMPAWLAWECFEESNGAPDFRSMVERIARLRDEAPDSAASGTFDIGCVMIAAPVFFEERDWVAPPTDWARTGIQQGKSYSLEEGEGRRVFERCLALAGTGARHWNVDATPTQLLEGLPRFGNARLVRPRLGQGLFALAVRDAYEGGCAVTGEHSTPALEAAHIKPYAHGGEHRIDNGLFLRRDLHSLFDRGYVTVTPDYEFRVGDRLRDEFKNGRSYYAHNGTRIALPKVDAWRPARELLDWHAHTVFRG